MKALPIPPRKVTELVPLPAQPPHVKTPDVEKVTGLAFAFDVPSATVARRNALISRALKIPVIFIPPLLKSLGPPHPSLTNKRLTSCTRRNPTRLMGDASATTETLWILILKRRAP